MTSFAKTLARAVEKHPVLYNLEEQSTAKKEDYDEAWQAVAFECEKPVSVIKSRWSKTVKSLMQHLDNPPQKSQGRKTRSSDFQLLDELKFLLPFVNNETPSWDTTISNENDVTDLKSTSSTASPSEMSIISKSQRDSSTESVQETCDSTLHGPSNVKTLASANVVSNDKRKREMSKSLIQNSTVQDGPAATEKKKSDAGKHFASESVGDSIPPIRFRRLVEDAAKLKQKDKSDTTADSADVLPTETEFVSVNNKLRNRSSSMYMERQQQSDDDDSDDVEYQPPPSKKIASSKQETKMVETSRTRAAKIRVSTVGLKRVKNTAVRSSSVRTASPIAKQLSNVACSTPVDSSNCNLLQTEDSKLEFGSGVDMSMIAAAAAAGKAEHEGATPVYGSDVSTQCNYEADEEDDEFLERTRLWLQRMNPRQKLVFRKGVYQAFLDVYDDPRNFDIQKGSDKFVITQLNGMPALFTGMTPIELRLVRQLAIAVAGSKLNSPPVGPKLNNPEMKCKSPSVLPLAPTTSLRSSLPPKPQLPTSTSPTGSVSNLRVQLTEKPPAVLRTTAIALSNQARSSSGVQRVLRKVVRVDNTSPNGSSDGVAQGSNTNGSSSSGNTNVNLARARTVSVNSVNGNNPQRIYRILPNGNIMRHCPTSSSGSGSGSGGSTSSNTSNSQTITFTPPASVTGSTAAANVTATSSQPLSSNNRLPTTSTLTTSTGTVITTRNISKPNQPTSHTQLLVDPKTGIKRQYVQTSNGGAMAADDVSKKVMRPIMSRRYSICSIPRDLRQQQPLIPEQSETKRWPSFATAATPQQPKSLPQLPTLANSSPKPIVRVRYAQNQSIQQTSALNSSTRAIASKQFALPAAVSPRKQQQHLQHNQANSLQSSGAVDSPVPVSISTSNSSSNCDNTEAIFKRAKLVYENTLLAAEHAPQNVAAPSGKSSQTYRPQNRTQEDKTNCIITSDMMDNFVVKNEPFDQDEEEMCADFMD